jgi:bromodomain and WD repeat domain containing protein 1/3
MKEVPEQYKPSDWLSEVIPRKTPYFPQIGDEVVYFRQGHQNYLNVTRSKELYDPGARCEPWLKKDLREVEYVRIVGIKYEIRPPRLCCLRLAIVDPVTGAFSSYFNIKYHDIPDVIDFLVLRQYYDAAMDKNWKVGEQFRCLIDDSWWIGTIEAQNAVDLDFPDSPFQCFQVSRFTISRNFLILSVHQYIVAQLFFIIGAQKLKYAFFQRFGGITEKLKE